MFREAVSTEATQLQMVGAARKGLHASIKCAYDLHTACALAHHAKQSWRNPLRRPGGALAAAARGHAGRLTAAAIRCWRQLQERIPTRPVAGA
jgi:hypothetical protein